MKKTRINAVIVLMSIVLIGLLIIQLVWINRAIELKEQQFSQSVHEALNEVALTLEKEEAFGALKGNFNQREMLPSAKALPFDFSWLEEQMKLFEAENESFIQGKKYSDTTFIQYTEIEAEELELISNDTAAKVSLSDKVENKKAIINEVLRSFLGTSRNINDRIDKKQMEEMIKNGLIRHGIKLKHYFLVKDYYGKSVFTNQEQDLFKKGTVYKITLFPNDFFNEPHFLYVYFPHQKKYIFKSISMLTISSLAFMLIVVFCFGYVVHIIFKQKKLNDMKTDFINNMTHELKTPVATISLASEMLKKDSVIENKVRANRYAEIIFDENKRLGAQVEKVLQTAVLEKGDFKLNLVKIDVHELIEKVLEKISLQIESNNGKVFVHLDAIHHFVMADEMHLTNIINNLLDNAIKYSDAILEITIKTKCTDNKLEISIADKGIGMSKENQQRAFEKFYRVSTGNIHNVKGFGLGLSYVKLMVEAHAGRVTVQSELNKGSTFHIFLPLLKTP